MAEVLSGNQLQLLEAVVLHSRRVKLVQYGIDGRCKQRAPRRAREIDQERPLIGHCSPKMSQNIRRMSRERERERESEKEREREVSKSASNRTIFRLSSAKRYAARFSPTPGNAYANSIIY